MHMPMGGADARLMGDRERQTGQAGLAVFFEG
jgi:hypothetical protein